MTYNMYVCLEWVCIIYIYDLNNLCIMYVCILKNILLHLVLFHVGIIFNLQFYSEHYTALSLESY